MDELAFWRNIALVFLIIQFFVFVVIGVAISYLLVRVSANLHLYTERAAHKAQDYSKLAVEKTEEYTEKVRKPVAETSARGAGMAATVRALLRGDKSQTGSASSTTTSDPPPYSPSTPASGSKT